MKNRPESPLDEAIEMAAAEWLVRHDRGLDAEDVRKFERWREADPRHAAVFRALAGGWELMERAGNAPSVLAEKARREEKRRGKRYRSLTVAVSLAAAVAVGAFVGWREHKFRPYEVARATEVGGVEKLELPDGSVVMLNTDSAVSVHFDKRDRQVVLERGEAHFSVAKESSRPFVVTANGVDVRAVGTAFSVRLRSEAVDVLVTEGTVSVAAQERKKAAEQKIDQPGPLLVEAGQRTSVTLAAGAEPQKVVEVPQEALKQALAWQERRLDFESATLGEIIGEMNRYSKRKLVIADPAFAEKRFGGSFPAGDVDTLLRQLKRNFGVTVEERGEELVLEVPR